MKKCTLITRLFVLMMAFTAVFVVGQGISQAVPNTWSTATTYGTSVNSSYWTGYAVKWDSGIHATEDWNDSDTYLSWDISYDSNTGKYSYSYTWNTDGKDLSHILLELTNDTFVSNLVTSVELTEKGGVEYDTWTSQQGNPNLPNSFYGIKLNLGEDTPTFTFSFDSYQAPVWGNFYDKDGIVSGTDTIAYNLGLNNLEEDGIFIARPNGHSVPEPTTLLLLGFGVLGVGLSAMRARNRD